MNKENAEMDIKTVDVVLIGGGIMSATLGTFLKELDGNISIALYERLPLVAEESSEGWNNAGTGHSAFCELNYTPEKEDGSIDISKALKIAQAYETSKAFWASLVEKGYLPDPKKFINPVPHISFVWGEENVAFLRKRYEMLSQQALFKGMEYSEDKAVLNEWMPLVMFGRKDDEPVAGTKMAIGTDVNFGVLTELLIKHFDEQTENVEVYTLHEVRDITRLPDGKWEVEVRDLKSNETKKAIASFVFIGAGGGTLKLLEKSDIPEAEGYGGFPISGQWLRCKNKMVISQHFAKVYGKASVGALPMSVPHLDTRVIDDERQLLFGPYAGFSTKFLKNGSYWDLPLSIEADNIYPMLAAGWNNMPLTKYLVQQVTQSFGDKIAALKEYYPEADAADWEEIVAGQRVQVIKPHKEEGGVLEFGTEVVTTADGSLAGLLGASPGASTAVSIMLEVLQKCFPEKFASAQWQEKLEKLIPCLHKDLKIDELAMVATRERSKNLLGV